MSMHINSFLNDVHAHVYIIAIASGWLSTAIHIYLQETTCNIKKFISIKS